MEASEEWEEAREWKDGCVLEEIDVREKNDGFAKSEDDAHEKRN